MPVRAFVSQFEAVSLDTTMRPKQCLFFLGVFVGLLVIEMSQGCGQNQTRQGCRIQSGVCLCGIGCYSEYRYTTKEECRKALRGMCCQRNPCFNGGACSQTSFEPGYRCRCEGTGYYGNRCQYDCSSTNTALQENGTFPYECVVI